MKSSFLPIIVLFVLLSEIVNAQGIQDHKTIKGNWFARFGTTINSHSYFDGDNKLYKELAVDYGVGNFISVGAYIGHQQRDYMFIFSNVESGVKHLDYSQTFIPIGLRGSFVLTPFVYDYLGIKLDDNKWNVYLTYFWGITMNKVKDDFNRSVSSSGEIIDYTHYLTDEDLSYKAGILTGVSYYPLRNFGLFVEGGIGPIGNINFGITTRY
ncbi:hypothetical protein KZP23_12990 [Echinicola marina]|uniref:hypothetical protein n=1 Tax=Echinicola marina TaxID=2859768 RepID=UPI001CF68FD2|nr:hypothetical protein [Echinicola marina]UCS91665.1 hypothetical protein KZP23_12990 [Echinicola marina]